MRSGTYALLGSGLFPRSARCAGWALVLTMLMPGAGQAQERCEPAAARIVSLQGAVEVQLAGTNVWTPATLGDALCLGDALRVGRASRAALALANDSTLRLDERTTLQLRGVAEERRSLLDLILGSVYFFSHRPRALEVDTPFVNAAAEGTEFLVRVGADRAEVVMLDGRVLLRNAQGELRVASGDAALIPEGEAPRPMVVARPRDAVAWALYYPPILSELAGRGAGARPLPPGLQTAVERVAANDYAGALDALDAVPEAARDARYHTYRAGVLLNVGRVEEAAAAIDTALALDPDAGDALAQRAIIHVVQNRGAEALADARRALELSPDSAAAAIALSYALQAAFQLEEAREVLRTAVERNPEDALAWARLSELEQMFGDLRASRNAAEQAVALAPDLARTQMVLGFAALTRIDIDGARAAFERAIALDSANPLPHLGLGLAIIRSGRLADGRKDIEIAAALDPNDALIRSYLGKAYFEEKRGPLDAEQFAIAKELDPNDPTPWFYDAIRLQTENRPVEALRNIERSIELNDNRAVYRSRLLLDEDLAIRETSLARIYDNLGFEQRGLVEATKSLSLDPANFSAHRFLSDVYARLPRREIARVSELLQAQLLQPININPVPPSLPFIDLNTIAGIGPAEGSFGEFHSFFERNQAQLTATGAIGTNDTLGEETVASALWNRISLSAGQLHSETDGFRDNYDQTNNVYNLYTQWAISPYLNLQAEYRHRDTDQGDLEFRFDPDLFFPDDRRNVDGDVARLGMRVSLAPGSDFIASGIYADLADHAKVSRDFTNDDGSTSTFLLNDKVEDQGTQIEVQHIFDQEHYNLVTGAGAAQIDVTTNTVESTDGTIDAESEIHSDRGQSNAYVYGGLSLPEAVTWTLGLGYVSFHESPRDVNELTPKVGVEWDITDRVRLRGAIFKTVKRPMVVDQTIEPTEVAGFNQFFDEANGTRTTSFSGGLDVRLTDSIFVGVEGSRRDIKFPFGAFTEERKEDFVGGYGYWALHPRWALTVDVAYEEFENNDPVDPDGPIELNTLAIPTAIRYFAPSGLFGEFQINYVYQHLKRGGQADSPDGNDGNILLNAAVGYRFPKRLGIASLEIANILNQKVSFQDDSFRSSQVTRVANVVPERTFLLRATISF
jgi:tetratricopeptide (TPR) repeat protein